MAQEPEFRSSRFVEDDPGTFIITSDRRLCEQCRWIRDVRKCEAFPDSIPKDIWEMEIQHDVVHPRQRGEFVWERKT